MRLGLSLLLLALLFRLPSPDSGFWRRGYLANLPMPTPAAWNAPAAGLPDVDSASDGIGAYLATECPAPEMPRALSALESLDLTWARTEIPWAGVEPRRGAWTWDPWDRVVDGLRGRNYRVLGMLCYWTGWVPPYSDAAIEAFGRYSEQVARRYRGRVDAWEVWNEPNASGYWQSTSAAYVRLLRAAYEGVKRGNPDAVVLGGSLSGVDRVYLRELLDLGAARWMDALSVHPYTFGWGPESSDLRGELRGVSAEMARAGKPHGLWVTEIGLGSRNEPKQARFLERSLVLMLQSRVVTNWFWFTLMIPGEGYSLYRDNWTPKPAALACGRLAGLLRDARPLGSGVPADCGSPWGAGSPYAPAGLQAWCFQKGGAIHRAAWVDGGRVEAGVLSGPGGGAVILEASPRWDILTGHRL